MKYRTHIILWIVLMALAIGWVKVSQWMDSSAKKPERVDIAKSPVPPQVQEQRKAETAAKKSARNATLEPGRVVTLDTSRGTIEFVLFEKDCPKTTARIAETVAAGAYDNVTFPRVEDWVIQVAKPGRDAPPMGCEFAKGLSNVVGTVGMARKKDRNSNTNVFYILKRDSKYLDYNYTVLGHVIKGMDVVNSIQLNDVIKKASLRASTEADAQLLKKTLEQANAK